MGSKTFAFSTVSIVYTAKNYVATATKQLKKVWLVVVLANSLVLTLFAQGDPSLVSVADDRYAEGKYDLAASLYTAGLKMKIYRTPLAYQRVADCYDKLGNFAVAAKWYAQLLAEEPIVNSEVYILYGDVLKKLGRYELAKAIYKKYPRQNESNIPIRLAGCDSALSWNAHPQKIFLTDLAINTILSDWCGVRIPTSNSFPQVAFVSDSVFDIALNNRSSSEQRSLFPHKGQGFFRFYLGAEDLNKSKVRGLGSAFYTDQLEDYDNGTFSLSTTGDSMLFTMPVLAEKELMATDKKSAISVRPYKLFITVKKNGKWASPKPVLFNTREHFSINYATFSPDGNVIYIVADKKGGLGRSDIWYCEKDTLFKTRWRAPINCGNAINTSGREGFPTFDKDGNMYFASDGLLGLGGLDTYKTTGQRNMWTAPENLRVPINTEADDFCMTFADDTCGYLSSNRKGGHGSDDIYYFVSRMRNKALLRLWVRDRKTRAPISSASVIIRAADKSLNDTLQTDERGFVKIAIRNDKPLSYLVSVVANNYISESKSIIPPKADTVDMPVSLAKTATKATKVKRVAPVVATAYDTVKLQKGTTIAIDNLLYATGAWQLTPSSTRVLDTLIIFMKKHPTMVVELSSHTDSRGDPKANLILSQKRAQSALVYMVKKGRISVKNLQARGYGDTRLKNGCITSVPCKPEDDAVNRRTEIKVLRINE